MTGAVLVPGREGAQPAVAFRQQGGVGGVGGVGGSDDRGAFPCHRGEPLRLLDVAGVLAGVAAGHQPVIGGGVLAVVALDEPAAADRQQPGVRVGDVAPRRPGRVRLPVRDGLRLRRGLQVRQPGAGPAVRPASCGSAGRRPGRDPAVPAARAASQAATAACCSATSLSSRSCCAASATAAGGRPSRCLPRPPAGRPAPAHGRRPRPPPARLPAPPGRPAPARPATADPARPAPCPRPAAGQCRAAPPCPPRRRRRPCGRPPSPGRRACAARPRSGWPPSTRSRRS